MLPSSTVQFVYFVTLSVFCEKHVTLVFLVMDSSRHVVPTSSYLLVDNPHLHKR